VKTLIPHFIHEQAIERGRYGSLRAYVWFADLSGFTALTEALMKKGPRGAEELSVILNDIFGPLVRLVYERGGFIPHFAGDSFYAIFPDGEADSCLQCLCAAASADAFFKSHASRFGGFKIALKTGLSHGEVEWGIAGHDACAFYFRGKPIDQAARRQEKAKGKNHHIVLDDAFRERIAGHGFSFLDIEPGYYAFQPDAGLAATPLPPAVPLPSLQPAILKAFLPDEVLEVQQNGEFRSVVSVFIALGGIEDRRMLHRVIQVLIDLIASFSAYLKEFDFGDKGALAACFFGAPVSFENNDYRALEFVYALRQKLRELMENKGFRFKVGMTLGTAYTGIVGGEERCQYAIVGKHVNLAARLMAHAHWGEVLTDESVSKNRHFVFQHRGEIHYKGVPRPIPTYRLEARTEEQAQVYSGALVGRDIELRKFLLFAYPLKERKPAGIAFVFGEAGIGKTRLTYEARKYIVDRQETFWAFCPTDQILRKPFNPFLYFLRNYFGQSAEDASTRNLERFENRFQNLFERLSRIPGLETQGLCDELTRTKSVLGALIGIVYPDSIWEQLDARGRYQNTIQAIVNLFCCEAQLNPLVVEIEDAHWMDQNSIALLDELIRQAGRFPMLLLVTSRFNDDGSHPAFFESAKARAADLPLLVLDLNALQGNFVRQFAENRLEGSISQDFLDLLLRTTNSNPFYLEQLLEYFTEQQLLEQQDRIWTVKDPNIELSSSINAILTARIDRLSALARETVKTAAVIGREFELPVLAELMFASEEFAGETGHPQYLLAEQVRIAEKGQIWRAISELRYIFRHTLLREAAYGMQIGARRQELHRLIAEAIERIYADNLEDRFFDLAFHYELAKIPEKTIAYLQKAGDYALGKFQNQQALEYFEKLLAFPEVRQDHVLFVSALLKKSKILVMTGNWEAAAKTLQEAAANALETRQEELLARSCCSYGHLLMLQGDYTGAMRQLQHALHLFAQLRHPAGMVETTGNLGNLYFRQGKYPEAENYFQDCIRKAREIPGYFPDSQIIANLGLSFMNRGEYEQAIRVNLEFLDSCEERKDHSGMANILTHLGIVCVEKGSYEEAMDYLRRALRINAQLGNKQLAAIATGNMGVIFERQGNYRQAMDCYLKDLELCEELGDKQGTAIALSLIGQLLNVQGEFHRAIEYMQKALMLCEELSYQKGIAKALNTLGDIFFFLQQHRRSLHFYNRAIELTRLINNKLVLGFSLVEKGTVLLETGDWEELKRVATEAATLADELGNPDLHFEAQLLAVKADFAAGHAQGSHNRLLALLPHAHTPDQEAAVRYELFRIDPLDANSHLRALQLYQKLYRETPRYLFKFRLDILERLVVS
jgi:predicted ATPase/class 3 adenylate cyclase